MLSFTRLQPKIRKYWTKILTPKFSNSYSSLYWAQQRTFLPLPHNRDRVFAVPCSYNQNNTKHTVQQKDHLHSRMSCHLSVCCKLKRKGITNLCVAPSFCFSYCCRCFSMSPSNIFNSSSQRSPAVMLVIPHDCNCWLKHWHACRSVHDIWPDDLRSKSHRNTVNFCSFWKKKIH